MSNLQESKDEVLRKIGRNVLNFQQLERQLKFILSHATESGTLGVSGTLHSNREKRIAKTRTKTMGQLIGQFVDEVHGDPVSGKDAEPLDQAWVSTSFRLKYDDNFYERKKAILSSLVDERNNLIHHFIDKYDLSRIEDCRNASDYLEEQHKTLIEQLTDTFNTVQALLLAKDKLAQYLLTEEGKRAINEQLGLNGSEGSIKRQHQNQAGRSGQEGEGQLQPL